MSAISGVVVSTLGAGAVLALLGWLRCGAPGAALHKEVGGPSWDFSKSWASNVTVVGAILGTILSAKVLPPKTVVVVSANGYTALSLLFGALVVLAPLVFVALPNRGTALTSGRGWAYLLAVVLTLWGVLGELVTVGLVLYEARHRKTLPYGGVVPMWCVIGAALLLVGLYGFRTVKATLRVTAPADDEDATVPFEINIGRTVTYRPAGSPFTIRSEEPFTVRHEEPPAQSWSLL